MDPLALVIFGITSNLSQIKLIPALYDMAEKNLLPKDMVIIGNARKPMTKQEIENFVKQVLQTENRHHKHRINVEILENLVSKIHYLDGHLDDTDFYSRLKELISKLSPSGNKIFYLATYPELYHHIFENLKNSNLSAQQKGWTRLMIEKPIGNNLSSAKNLNNLLLKYFSEDQIYRLDHYLGKETIQNILAFRFGNGIFEPLMNKDYIDHIQITAAEDFGIGKRGGYFDKVGMLKDTGQNHQLQMLAFATMDAPTQFSNRAITDERIKILDALVPLPGKIIYGQYESYQNEENIDQNSQTDTYYAFKTQINNSRYKGVPIYIRAGKKLKETVTEIAIVFKTPESRLFKKLECGMEPNVLIYRIQPNEGIVLKILTKKPGHKIMLEEEFMEFCYKNDPDKHTLPDPYERLISDAIRGDQTFFNDAEEVEAQWKFIDALSTSPASLHPYKEGTWGPSQADDLLKKDNKSWIEPSMLFCRI